MFLDGWVDGWMDGWVDRWVGVKAVLRIAYSNQKLVLTGLKKCEHACEKIEFLSLLNYCTFLSILQTNDIYIK
jgi:hypothetical protein